MNRRRFLMITAGAGVAAVLGLKPGDRGAAYSAYFETLNRELRAHGPATPSLSEFQPAAYIAAPVLKKLKGTTIPAAEAAREAFAWWDPNQQQTFFMYGGHWLARYESPPGLQPNGLYGHSTNQQMVNGSNRVALEVDDHIFLRPNQSEFVFLQFGDLLAVRGGRIVDRWAVLKQ